MHWPVWACQVVTQGLTGVHCLQEGYLAKYAVNEEDRLAAEQARADGSTQPQDPMQGLEELDVAGPKPE